jgi:hypothetical protein
MLNGSLISHLYDKMPVLLGIISEHLFFIPNSKCQCILPPINKKPTFAEDEYFS